MANNRSRSRNATETTARNVPTQVGYIIRKRDSGGAVLALRRVRRSQTDPKYFWSKRKQCDYPPVVFTNISTARKVASRYGGGVIDEVNSAILY